MALYNLLYKVRPNISNRLKIQLLWHFWILYNRITSCLFLVTRQVTDCDYSAEPGSVHLISWLPKSFYYYILYLLIYLYDPIHIEAAEAGEAGGGGSDRAS